jgi:hypothetical protein
MIKTLVALAAVLTLALAGTAQARWFLSKGAAQRATRHEVALKYHDTGVVARCRPYGRPTADPSYDYHRWVCGWAGDALFDDGTPALCHGTLLIAGSRVNGYQWQVYRGERCQ